MITAQITGNITRDPELKAFGDGGQVAKISLAVKQTSKKMQDGSWQDRKVWYVDADVWGRDAIAAVDKIKKGDYVLLSGVLERDHWTGQDGQERESYRLKKAQYEILVSKADREVLKNTPKAASSTGACPMPNAAAAAASFAQGLDGDEIPF